jgi:hypothetical protein
LYTCDIVASEFTSTILEGLQSTLILEAFAEYLQVADDKIPATDILARWLWERLSIPPETVVDRVLHCEIQLSLAKGARKGACIEVAGGSGRTKPTYVFTGNSASGRRLLKSLYEYCLSYEQQKWARWVHSLKASDFKSRN